MFVCINEIILDNWVEASQIFRSFIFAWFCMSNVNKDQTRKLSKDWNDPAEDIQKYIKESRKEYIPSPKNIVGRTVVG